MKSYQLAQINVARFKAPKDDPANADFMNALDHVNAKAEASSGFIWRLIGAGNDATDLQPDSDDPNLIVNMSVWADLEALKGFVYGQTDHVAVFKRRTEWFEKLSPSFALWWIETGHVPSVEEGMGKLAFLRASGPTADAFTFARPFGPPDEYSVPPIALRA